MRKRIEDTGRSLKMLQTFIQERAALEEQYAASLRELLKRHAAPFPDPWSTSEAWKALRAEADETQRVHQQLSQQLATEVARPLEYFHRQQSQSSKLVRAPIDVSPRCVYSLVDTDTSCRCASYSKSARPSRTPRSSRNTNSS